MEVVKGISIYEKGSNRAESFVLLSELMCTHVAKLQTNNLRMRFLTFY